MRSKLQFRVYEGPGDDNLITLAVFAQEESLEQQLQWGVRGLDIRVAYCNLKPLFRLIFFL